MLPARGILEVMRRRCEALDVMWEELQGQAGILLRGRPLAHLVADCDRLAFLSGVSGLCWLIRPA
jgi:hypothetical protein